MRDRDELGPRPVSIYADSFCVRTKMTPAGETITAMSARDVPFADNKITFGKTFHVIADPIDHADELVSDGDRHGDGLLSPGIPVIYMYVRPADRGFEDTDAHIVAADFRHGDCLEPKAGLSLRFHHGLHRFLHDGKLSESGTQENRKVRAGLVVAAEDSGSYDMSIHSGPLRTGLAWCGNISDDERSCP